MRPRPTYPITPEDAITSSRYKQAGVDIDAGNALVEAIKPLAASTRRSGSLAGLGGFGALFDPKAAGFRDPLLVSGTDGVGTKLKIAIESGRHETVGIDLVAMCVNDILVQGAEPLFFLDYFACGRLEVAAAQAVVAGIAEGCRAAGCALIGGETAEMPGMYAPGDYDLAGFALGAVERGELLPRGNLREGDLILGIASSGLHSNGFSLVRRLLAEVGADLSAPAPFEPKRDLAAALLEPTRIYVKPCLAAIRSGDVKALAHITGGGLLENLPRVLPNELNVALEAESWPLPPVFAWLRDAGRLESEDMLRTFNCGIGMALICAPEKAASVKALLGEQESVYEIGRLIAASGGARVKVEGLAEAWAG